MNRRLFAPECQGTALEQSDYLASPLVSFFLLSTALLDTLTLPFSPAPTPSILSESFTEDFASDLSVLSANVLISLASFSFVIFASSLLSSSCLTCVFPSSLPGDVWSASVSAFSSLSCSLSSSSAWP